LLNGLIVERVDSINGVRTGSSRTRQVLGRR
jgi:hypothetical protein